MPGETLFRTMMHHRIHQLQLLIKKMYEGKDKVAGSVNEINVKDKFWAPFPI